VVVGRVVSTVWLVPERVTSMHFGAVLGANSLLWGAALSFVVRLARRSFEQAA
jgi:hypothetical protein